MRQDLRLRNLCKVSLLIDDIGYTETCPLIALVHWHAYVIPIKLSFVCQKLLTCNILYFPTSRPLKMKAEYSLEASITGYPATRRRIPGKEILDHTAMKTSRPALYIIFFKSNGNYSLKNLGLCCFENKPFIILITNV